MSSSKETTAQLGSHIVLAGLIIQIILFGFFVVVGLIFHRRLYAVPTNLSQDPLLPWSKYLYILYITCGFIMFRSIVRVAEFVQGFEGEIYTHEVFLFVFDAIPMAAVMVSFNIWYPSFFSKQARKAIRNGECSDLSIELSS